jgi:hypothetical protein
MTASDDALYKREKELFISNHTGGPVHEINLVCLSIMVTVAGGVFALLRVFDFFRLLAKTCLYSSLTFFTNKSPGRIRLLRNWEASSLTIYA